MVALREHFFGSPPELRVVPKLPGTAQRGVARMASTYRGETRRPFSSYIETFFRTLTHATEIENLNFGRTFEDLVEMVKSGEDLRVVMKKKLFSTALNMWSLRQEMTGERSTIEVVTPVVMTQEGVKFWSDVHSIQDIEELFEHSLDRTHNGQPIVPETHKPRQRRENRQLTQRWRAATKILQTVDMSQPLDELTVQLRALGFRQQRIPITPSLIANIPSLREQFSDLEDLFQVIDQQETLTVWAGPAHHMTVSPPHWIHAQGKSSFAWNTQVIVLPETKEIWLSEHGLFSHTPLESILQVLAWGDEEDLTFSSEEEVMMYVNTIMEHSHIPPSVMLHHIVSTLEGFQAAPKIDDNIVEGKFVIQPFLQVVEELFQFELERSQSNPEFLSGMYERLQFVAKKVMHLIALNDAKGLTEILAEYKKAFASVQTAQKPHLTFGHLDSFSVSVNQGFKIPIRLDLLDCVFNPTGYLGKIAGQNLGSMSRTQLGDILGERAKLWKEGLECIVCHKKGWVGECNICLNCEMKMNTSNPAFSSSMEPLQAVRSTGERISSRPFIQLFPPPENTISLTQAISIGPKHSLSMTEAFVA